MKTYWVLVTCTAYQVTFYPGPPTAASGAGLAGWREVPKLRHCQSSSEPIPAHCWTREVPYPQCLRSN